jgi:hypothetical protein
MKELQAAYLRAALRSRWAFWGLFGGAGIALVYGAAFVGWRGVLGGIALTPLVVFLAAYVSARSRAAREFYGEVAAGLGLAYTRQSSYPPVTPLLSAGSRQRFDHAMQGPLLGKLGGPPCLLSHFTYDSEYASDTGNRAFKPVPFTVCVIEIGTPLWRFRGLYLRQRMSALGFDHDWLGRAPKPERVTLESARFDELYDLRRASDQDEFAIRELFSPSFVAWLADHPLRPGFECKAGTLVVFIRGHADSAGTFAMLQETSREIARRLAKQVVEGDSLGSPHFSAAGQTIR